MKLKHIVAAVVLVVSMSVPCLADDPAIAKVGTEEFSDIAFAIGTAAEKGLPVEIIADFNLTQSLSLYNGTDKTVTVDFQNHKVNYTGNDSAIGTDGNFIIKNANVVSSSNTVTHCGTNKTMTIEGGSYVSNGGSGMEVNTGSTLIINNATFTELGNGSAIQNNNSTVIVNSGTFTGKNGHLLNTGGNTTINGGTFKTTGTGMTVNADGTLTITGGTFSSGKTACAQIGDNGTATISGGTFNSKNESFNAGKKSKVTISGGTFKTDVFLRGNSNVTIKGGSFTTVTSEGGKVTFNGGNVSKYIYCFAKGNIKIKKVTVKQKKPVKAMLGCSGKGSKITVSGGTFTSPKGYGYYVENKGKVSISKKAAKKFKVKAMQKNKW